MTFRALTHLALHGLVPLGLALTVWRDMRWRAFGLLMAGMVIDLDHLLAVPVFDPARCSIGFHPLHTIYATAAYVVLTAVPKTRIFGVGLLVHIALDGMDCVWMNAISATSG